MRIASTDVQAFGDAIVALRLAQHRAKEDAEGERLWEEVQRHRPSINNSDADFFLSWLYLCEADGPLSDRSLYRWTFRNTGRDSPLMD